MKFTIHGVRGSVPTPKEGFLKYGGNTTCFEIETEQHQLFCDAGSGFQSAQLLRDTKDTFVFFTHFHHDHIQGFPFNAGLFKSGKKIVLSSGLLGASEVSLTMQNYFSGRYFPVDIFNMLRHLTVEEFEESKNLLRGDVAIDCITLQHPGGAVGYSFVSHNKKIVLLLDNEFCTSQKEDLLKFCENADLLVWDGMFTQEELTDKKGWGHSSIEQAVDFTELSSVKKTLICHHAPNRSDEDIDKLRLKILSHRVDFGFENMVLTV